MAKKNSVPASAPATPALATSRSRKAQTPAPAPVAAPVVAKVSTPKVGGTGPVSQVWAICEAMAGQKRSVVIAACVAKGLNVHTAKTQFQRWFRSRQVPATANA